MSEERMWASGTVGDPKGSWNCLSLSSTTWNYLATLALAEKVDTPCHSYAERIGHFLTPVTC